MQQEFTPVGCARCIEHEALDFDFTMAFQPIVSLQGRSIFAHEALVRGINQEPAGDILGRVNDENRYMFDQACRVRAIKLASELNMDTHVSINFLPNAIYQPELCISATLEAAKFYQFPVERIIFEVTETEQVRDTSKLKDIITTYRRKGFKTAIDDFGAGYAGLNLLAEFQPDIIKLDMALIRNIDTELIKRSIVQGIISVAQDLGIEIIAEGVETSEELCVIQDMGVDLIQGYYFAKPAFQDIAEIDSSKFSRPI